MSIKIATLILLFMFVSPFVNAGESNDDPEYQPDFAAVPFAFASENLSTAFGGAAVLKHAGQPQASLFGFGLYTTNESWVGYLGVNNYQLPGLSQWLFSGELYQGVFQEGVYYLPDANEGAQKTLAHGDERFAKFHAKYVLPTGWGRHGAAASMRSHGTIDWDPLESGVSSFQLSGFMQSRKLDETAHLPQYARGLELLMEWDNRDNGRNSTQGGRSRLKVRHGFEADGSQDWTTWEFEQSAFLSVSASDMFRQQILAANFYLADTPSWSRQSDGKYHRPPQFAGIALGGFERLRGHATRRFTGRSALLYTLEYRVQPHWQPLQNWSIFNFYDVPWWQWVTFVEAGKVSDTFSADALHEDMAWSVGAGVRFEVESVVVRAEFGISAESNQFWVMVSQPF
ncbi:MAG: hypothetical protein LPD71_08545 [Shewanella sp.]|nr:hypothetical protein [Shewanella sp.]MCF1438776.1 hypothetical protein [Shewanella sp.]